MLGVGGDLVAKGQHKGGLWGAGVVLCVVLDRLPGRGSSPGRSGESAEAQPLHHQGDPVLLFLNTDFI